jgi:hypothetical protein
VHGVDVPAPGQVLRSPAVRVALVVAGLLLACLALASVQLTGRPATLCLLRAVTGVPCPLCGSTTAAVELGAGRPLAALAASPLAVLGGAALALAPLAPSALRDRVAARRTPLVLTALGLGELWQLARLL